MLFLKIFFFFALFILFYSYLGYGILLWVLLKLRKALVPGKKEELRENEDWPPVTLVVAAYNEAGFIEEKIRNSISLEYPEGNLKLIVITDGSTDGTPELAGAFPQVQLLHLDERRGKVAAMHRAMAYVTTDVVIFSDANTLLNGESIKNIMRHYRNPEVGGVAGEKKIRPQDDGAVAGAGEGLYWKYESFLKRLDWEFYSVVGAAGELFSIRTGLYEYPGDNVLLDDFIISLRVCRRGYRIAYEPGAYAMEAPSASMKEEKKRKVRISAGGFQSIGMLSDLLNPFKYPKLSFQYISHRILRWTLCPLFLPLLLIANILLVVYDGGLFYQLVLGAQAIFYLLALLGWVSANAGKKVGFLYAPYYFLFINFALYLGFFRFLKGKQTVLWEKAGRAGVI